MKTIFLDFDGVLHSSSIYISRPFSRLNYFEPLLENFNFDVVISSTWRFHYEIGELRLKLQKLGKRVIGVTGENFNGLYPRFNEIKEYADFNQISDWRAVDDAKFEFPDSEKRLIYCNPQEGITSLQTDLLANWLKK